jgi:hypothetical protein
MTFFTRCFACVASLCLITAISSIDAAQGSAAGAQQPPNTPQAGAARGAGEGRGGDGRGGRGAFVPEPVPPARNFATSTEHYEYLRQLHNGGTRHTYASIPKWEGLWSAAGNTSTTLFLKGGGGPNLGTGGEIIPGVLTPAYEAAFKMRLEPSTTASRGANRPGIRDGSSSRTSVSSSIHRGSRGG